MGECHEGRVSMALAFSNWEVDLLLWFELVWVVGSVWLTLYLLLGLSLGFGALSASFEAGEEAEHFACILLFLVLCL